MCYPFIWRTASVVSHVLALYLKNSFCRQPRASPLTAHLTAQPVWAVSELVSKKNTTKTEATRVTKNVELCNIYDASQVGAESMPGPGWFGVHARDGKTD
jgi:hypothetical protein